MHDSNAETWNVVQGRLNRKIWSERASYFHFRHAFFNRMVEFFHIMLTIAIETRNVTCAFAIIPTDFFLKLLEGYRVCKLVLAC